MNDPKLEPRHDPYGVLRNPNYALYLIGRFLSSLGGQMMTVAVGWELYERTGQPLALGLVGLAQFLPMILFTLPAGHVADCFNRQKIILLATGAIALACLGLAVVSFLHAPVGWTYGCLALLGAARTFLWPSSASFLPQLVPREQFSQAVTWNSSSFQLSSVIGPAAGGFLLAFTHKPALIYGINALASLLCLLLISLVRPMPRVAVWQKMSFQNLYAGFKFVFESRVVFGTITLDLFAVLFGGASALLPIFARDILHSGPSGLGLLESALPLGSLAMAMVLAHRPPLQKAGRALMWAVAVFGLATIGFGLSHSFWLSFAMLVICGAADSISIVVRHTLVQLLTPDDMRGRVAAVNSLFIGTSNELGGFESGAVAQRFGAVAAAVSGGIGTLFTVVTIARIWPELRRYGALQQRS